MHLSSKHHIILIPSTIQSKILFSFMALTTTKINDRNDVEENTVCDVEQQRQPDAPTTKILIK